MFVNITIELVVRFIICFYGLQFAISYHSFKGVRVMMFNTTFQQYFSYIVHLIKPFSPKATLDLQLPVQSVPSTTKVVCSNPIYGEVYSIQHYVMKFVSDLRQVSGFLRVPLPIKLTTMNASEYFYLAIYYIA
jgi:hypothetical protein